MYLLDTNNLCKAAENPSGTVAEKISKVPYSEICTSVFVEAELRFGAIKSGSQSLISNIEAILEVTSIEPWKDEHTHRYASLRLELERGGGTMGQMDMLIFTQAVSLSATIVTGDQGFNRAANIIGDIEVINWDI